MSLYRCFTQENNDDQKALYASIRQSVIFNHINSKFKSKYDNHHVRISIYVLI